MSATEKQKVLKLKGCCFACLKPGHIAKRCRAVLKCCVCGNRHVTMMCERLKSRTDLSSHSEPQNVTLASFPHNPKVLLQTLRVKLVSDRREICVRALIDTGSQRSYILKEVAEKMYVPQREETVIHSLFGGINTESRKHQCYQITLGNLDGNFTCNFVVFDNPIICQGVSSVKYGSWIAELKKKGISLTDVGHSHDPIVILIGADVAGRLLTGCREELSSGLVAMETRLGWTLIGKVPPEEMTEANVSMMVTSLFIEQATLSDLWRLDLIGITDVTETKSKNEQHLLTKQHFLETVKVNNQGRYEVCLPWLEGHPPLCDNKHLAMTRLRRTTKKLESDNLLEDYDTVLQQWLNEGIIEEVPAAEENQCSYYLPHRPVVKDSSSTTRIRPVFDASARAPNQHSLNQCLDSGPNFIELIPDIFLKFRLRRFGVIADIKQAFLQISVNKKDRKFLSFLWWDKTKRFVKIYRHTRVVFGVTCSSFLLGAVIDYHVQNVSDLDEQGAQDLAKSFYVDNLVASKDTEDEIREFVSDTCTLLAKGKFELRGWETSLDKEGKSPSPVLGVCWDKFSDVWHLNLDWICAVKKEPVTKRTILSVAHKLFDPVGVTSPVMICPKILLQRAWKTEEDWDAEVTEDIKEEFLRWFDQLHFLKEVRIHRWLGTTPGNKMNCSIHTFCDASLKAYATVIYLRIETENDVIVRLLASKSRVAPLKNVTMPRLELLAALIGARLANSVVKGLKWNTEELYFWSDSTTVLSWIFKDEKWSVFVRNRIQEIRLLTRPSSWGHVIGETNPADLPSRGCGAKNFVAEKWWEGPTWMKTPMETWPCSKQYIDTCDQEAETREKMKTTSLLAQGVKDKDCFFKKFSSYNKTVRVVTWMLRFKQNCFLAKQERQHGEITYEEFCKAEKKVIIQIQEESFTDENDEKLRTLNVFKDSDGILKVTTKIVHRKDTDDFRKPMILPSKHEVVKRLIWSYHISNCHAGVGTLLSILRERYWILNGRKAIRSVISSCTACRRHASKRLETVAATLPENRIRDAAVFEVTGLDMAGPLFLKSNEKVWVCLFTCAVYRAVHLELVTSLSTDSFLLALRRFVARRGRCSFIYSYNGTNFQGAVNVLKSLNWNLIVKYSAVHRIEWRFNPPTAAWWGGWWERIIRIMKDLLKRILGKACLTYEELATVLCDCESTINSRPLTYVSENPPELIPLSPAIFLHDIKEIGLPDCDAVDHCSLNRRVKYRQSLQRELRYRFRKGCRPGLCGSEAACNPKPDNKYECVCPHDGSPPTEDLKCPNRITVTATPRPIIIFIPPREANATSTNTTSTQQQAVREERLPVMNGLLIGMLGVALVAVVISIALCLIKRKEMSRCISRNGKHRKSSCSPSPLSLSKGLLVPNRYTPNPQYSACATPDAMLVPLISRENVQFLQEIGEGCFGKVYKGELHREGEVEVVAVKVLKDTATREAEEDLMREVDIMSAFRHPNILSLVGVVPRDSAGNSPWMVFEYMPHGDLAEVLRSNSRTLWKPLSGLAPLTKRSLLSVALQIAAGMEYLAGQRFVHRDLACRNCLVGVGLTVKIADFGMSRDVYTCDYYKIGGSRLLPVRWMSPESVMYGRFTLESDVWSYGVVLWEIYSLGKQPYYGHTNEEVVKLILQGIMLIPPEDCPTVICELMRSCWKTEPRDRIRFTEVYSRLRKTFEEEEASNPSPTPPPLPATPPPSLIPEEHLPRPPGAFPSACLSESADLLDSENYLLPQVPSPDSRREYLQPLPD